MFSAWSATAQATTLPNRHEIGIGLGKKFWKGWAGSFTEYGPPTGSTTRSVRQTGCAKSLQSRFDELKRRQSDYTKAARPRTDNAGPARACGTVESTLLPAQEPRSEQQTARKSEPAANGGRAIAVGDTVRVRYLTDDRKTLHFTISFTKSDPSHGIIYHKTPIAKALLGAEEGDEVEVLVGSYVRFAIVESITKNAGS